MDWYRKAQEDLLSDVVSDVMMEMNPRGSDFNEWWYTMPQSTRIANLAAESASLEVPVVQIADFGEKKALRVQASEAAKFEMEDNKGKAQVGCLGLVFYPTRGLTEDYVKQLKAIDDWKKW
jgi:hypothetical protein